MSANRKRHVVVCGLGQGMARSLGELCRRLDLDVTVITDRPHEEGLDVARRVIRAYPRSVDEVLAALAREPVGAVDAVFSLGYENLPVVAALGARLSTRACSMDAATACTLKDRRIGKMGAAGVNVPRFRVTRDRAEAERAAAALGFPVVVKPNDKTSSIGVRRVDEAAQVTMAFLEAAQHSATGTVLVEEYLRGTEHTFEGIVHRGNVRFSGVSDRNYSKKEHFYPYFFEDGDTLPSRLTRDARARIEAQLTRALASLGIDDTAFHCDILLAEDGTPYVLEVVSRLAGSRFGTEIVPLSTGVNVLFNAVRVALGDPIVEEELEPASAPRAVVLRYLPARAGRVSKVGSLEGLKALSPQIYDVSWEMDLKEGQVLTGYRSGKDMIASVIATGDSIEEAEAAATMALGRLPLELDDVA